MNLVERVKNILVQPAKEWQAIDTEAIDTAGLYTGYIVPLAAIGPVATVIGMSLIGVSLPFVGRYRLPFTSSLLQGVVSYVLTLAGVFVLALIIDALAPTFSGRKDQAQALKVAAYSSTAAWVAGIFSLIPALSILGIVGLYSLYLLYAGLPVLMKSPQEKALGYTAVVVICAIVLFVVIGYVASAFITYPAFTPPMPGAR